MVVDVDVDELGVFGKYRGLAEVETEVEQRSDDEDEVGLTKGLAASTRKEQGVAACEHSSGHAVDVQRQVRGVHKPSQLLLRTRPPNAASGDGGWPLRLADEPGDPLDRVRVGRRPEV